MINKYITTFLLLLFLISCSNEKNDDKINTQDLTEATKTRIRDSIERALINLGSLNDPKIALPYYAAKYRNLEVLQYASANHFTMNILTREGVSPVTIALENQDRGSSLNKVECMKILLQATDDAELLPFTHPLTKPEVLCEQLDTIKWDTTKRTHRDILSYLLYRALFPKNLALFSKVATLCSVEVFIQPYQQGSIMRHAASRGAADLVKVLLEHGAPVEASLLNANFSDEIKALLTPKSFQPKMF